MKFPKFNLTNSKHKTLAAVALTTALGACQTTFPSQQVEGIGYREARLTELTAIREWRSCKDEALEIDRLAQSTGNVGKYLASARLIEKCESELGDITNVAVDERMHAYALGIQNYFKVGDISKARDNLSKFKEEFSGKDLYYADGGSFIETMEILVGVRSRKEMGAFELVNINNELKSELKRIRYWTRN